jgi:hypothetical protein
MPFTEYLRRLTTYAAWTAAILFVPALVSALLASWSAWSDGHIALYSVGKTETTRELVPWVQGWSRLLSPIVLVAAAVVYPTREHASAARLLLFVVLATAGSSILIFSLWFKSASGILVLAALLTFVALAHFIDQRFGRRASLSLIVVTAAALVAAYAAA